MARRPTLRRRPAVLVGQHAVAEQLARPRRSHRRSIRSAVAGRAGCGPGRRGGWWHSRSHRADDASPTAGATGWSRRSSTRQPRPAGRGRGRAPRRRRPRRRHRPASIPAGALASVELDPAGRSGDWVVVGRRRTSVDVLPRASLLRRQSPDGSEQHLVPNLDVLLIVVRPRPAGEGRRRSSGRRRWRGTPARSPIVVLTKADLARRRPPAADEGRRRPTPASTWC